MHAKGIKWLPVKDTASFTSDLSCEYDYFPDPDCNTNLTMSGKRKILTLEQKVSVLKELESGLSCRAVSVKYGCGKTQIASIKTAKLEIMKQLECGARGEQKYLKRRKATYEEFNNLVWDWFCAARSKDLPVSGRLIQEKALTLSVEMGHDDFTASNGWLESWQKRHNVKLAQLHGESGEVSEQTVADWTKRLPELTSGYDQADIFNADETGLYYRALTSRSMVVAGDPRRGTKSAKERVTVLLGCSATGEKLKPLVIGKAENPRCFRGVDKALLPVSYHANKKAWITATIFQTWVERLNSRMKHKGRSILLFIDNCSAHPELYLSHVKVVFLPPNTTSRLQPCDAGIIAAFKAHYRKRLLRHVLAEMDTGTTATDLSKQIDLKDSIHWINCAWTAISETCIEKCFRKCGFYDQPVCDLEHEEDDEELDPQLSAILGDVSWNEYVSMDSNTATVNSVDEDFDEKLKAKARGEDDSSASEEECDDDSTPQPSVISMKDRLCSVKHLIGLALTLNNPVMIQAAHTMQSCLQQERMDQMKLTQKNIQDFFPR